VIGSTPEQFHDNIRSEIAKWSRIVKAAGIKLEN
jgi:tripartite-type tricarboxylate transporter receptor subunit TctC